MDYKALTEEMVIKCKKKGADAAEVYLASSRNLSVRIRNGDIETVQQADSHGVGIRVLCQGRMAFSSCNDLSETALEETVASAVRFAASTTAEEHNVLPDEMGVTRVEGLYDPQIAQVPLDTKIEMVIKVEELAMKDGRITLSSGASYGENEGQIFLANSNGLSKNYQMSACSYGVSVVAEKGDQKSPGGESCSRRFFADLEPPEKLAEKAIQEAVTQLDPRMIETQRAAVIFHSDVARAVWGGVLGAIDGERVLQGASFLGNKMDQQIGSELITLIDDGTRSKGMGSKWFDGEGVPTRRRIVVEKGVLRGFLYNTIAAKRAGVKSTGNASRGSFRSLPGIGAHNFYMVMGEYTPEEIIQATDKGLLLKGITGYGINPVNGNFSGGASGFWIEKGKIAFPVKGITVAGKAEEMLNGIDMVGDDLDLNRSFTAPTFRIKDLQIGGR
jgi:PmbA protein